MALETTGETADELLENTLWLLKTSGVKEKSRVGEVYSLQQPVIMTLVDPTKRVVLWDKRNANPFFHLVETDWMMNGERYVKRLLDYNPRMLEYANDGILNAAYGYRWREHFKYDQLEWIANKLQQDPTTRQAVLTMWDPVDDHWVYVKDRACNTHAYFRVVDGRLNCLVCNRSNDVIWGALGANIVHLTYMMEWVANRSGYKLGIYQVMSNNLHIYERHWHLLEDIAIPKRWYASCIFDKKWKGLVLNPAEAAWKYYKEGKWNLALEQTAKIQDEGWRIACTEWLLRKYNSLETATPLRDFIQKEQLNLIL